MVFRLNVCWFLHKILGPKMLRVVVEFASLVSEIVVYTLTSWLRGTRYVTRHQMISKKWFIHVINKSEAVDWFIVVARFKRWNYITLSTKLCAKLSQCSSVCSSCDTLFRSKTDPERINTVTCKIIYGNWLWLTFSGYGMLMVSAKWVKHFHGILPSIILTIIFIGWIRSFPLISE